MVRNEILFQYSLFLVWCSAVIKGLSFCLTSKNGDIAIKTHATDIMDQADLGVLHLYVSRLVSELQYNGADLGSASSPDWMAF